MNTPDRLFPCVDTIISPATLKMCGPSMRLPNLQQSPWKQAFTFTALLQNNYSFLMELQRPRTDKIADV